LIRDILFISEGVYASSLTEAADQQEAKMPTTSHMGIDQAGSHAHIAGMETHGSQEILGPLMGLIEEAVGVHLQLQILTQELHGQSELSRACRGILRDLYRLGPRTVPQLARGRPVSRQNVLTLVNRLIADGLAEAIRNPEHKRSYLVRLTPRGKALLEQIWSHEIALLKRLNLNLSANDLEAAAKILHQLREALEKHQRDQE
jgi:DNA-binding MarR family transcriptional regulator